MSASADMREEMKLRRYKKS